jgi:hypothetical protein
VGGAAGDGGVGSDGSGASVGGGGGGRSVGGRVRSPLNTPLGTTPAAGARAEGRPLTAAGTPRQIPKPGAAITAAAPPRGPTGGGAGRAVNSVSFSSGRRPPSGSRRTAEGLHKLE